MYLLSWHNYHQSSLSPSFPVWTISCLTPKPQEVRAIFSRGQTCFCLSTQLPGPRFLSSHPSQVPELTGCFPCASCYDQERASPGRVTRLRYRARSQVLQLCPRPTLSAPRRAFSASGQRPWQT